MTDRDYEAELQEVYEEQIRKVNEELDKVCNQLSTTDFLIFGSKAFNREGNEVFYPRGRKD